MQEQIEEIARASVLTDGSDLPGLVKLRGMLQEMHDACDEASSERLRSNIANVLEAIDALVLRSTDDADAGYRQVLDTIDSIQSLINDAANVETEPSRQAAGLESEPAAENNSEPANHDLINDWIESSTDRLADLESLLISHEIDVVTEEGQAGESLAELRRGLHTIKGECGVLGLSTVQQVFHDAETLIDQAVEAKQPLPTDPLLAMLDWFRSHLGRIEQDANAEPTGHEEILHGLRNEMAQITMRQGSKRIAPPKPQAQSPQTPAPPIGTGDAETTDPVAEGEPSTSADTAIEAAPPAQDEPRGTPKSESESSSSSPTVVEEPMQTSAPAADEAPSLDEGIVSFVVEDPSGDSVQEFMYEAREHLHAAEQALLELEQSPDDSELINTVFRAFHTIKGVAGFMELTPIVSLAHNAEYLLDAIRTRKIELAAAHLDLALIACDTLLRLLGMMEGGPAVSQKQFDALNNELTRTSHGEPPSEDLSALRPEAADADSAAASAEDDQSTSVETPTPSAATEPASGSPERTQRVAQTVKVSTLRMDNLVTMVGELVIAQQMLVQDTHQLEIKDQGLHRNLTQVGKIVRDLQEASMSLRMVSLRSTFQKMARLVRDVSAKAGKQISFHTEGDDVELDRNVVEEIADPLVHMVRNACDHGIEPIEDRRAAGKPDRGNLTLRAYHSGGSIVIEIEDDGRGLSREKILNKAIDKGILPMDRRPEDLTDSEVFNLVFEAGFSTAEKVTDISGRGVGMDVVRRNIEALRGKVDIRSTFGEGTTFMMRLPLTMAIIDGMIVRVGSQRYVIPTLTIEQSFRPTENEIKTVLGSGEMVKVRGEMLPVYRLNRVMNVPDGTEEPTEGLLIVLESNDKRCALMADEIIDQQQIVIKNLGQGVGAIRGVSGGAILGDGRVALILDIGGIINQATAAPIN